MIRFEEVSKRYGSHTALAAIDLEIAQGEVLALLGPSGCGKTTTLKLVNRLLEPSSGRIFIKEKDAAQLDPIQLRRSIGYVLQRFGLFPHMTLAENVAVVPGLLGHAPEPIASKTDELLNLLGLPAERFRERYPHELSGGQQQRVGLARALAGNPEILLMDEPFGSLDPITRDRLQGEYRRIHDKLKLTTVIVTHDVNEALLLADRIAVMAEGRIAQLATPAELLASPADAHVQALMQTPQRQLERLAALSRDAKK